LKSSAFVKPWNALAGPREMRNAGSQLQGDFDLLNNVECSSLVRILQQGIRSGRILVIDPSAKATVFVSSHRLPVALRRREDIEEVLSHRWDNVVLINGKPFPTSFIDARYDRVTWVDCLSHLNDPALTQITLQTMGKIYARTPCRALYLERPSEGRSALQTGYDAMVRGWMWQELVPGPQNHRYSGDDVKALHLLFRNKKVQFAIYRISVLLRSAAKSVQRHDECVRLAISNLKSHQFSRPLVDDLTALTEALIKTDKGVLFFMLSDLCRSMFEYDAKYKFPVMKISSARTSITVGQLLEFEVLPLLIKHEGGMTFEDLALQAMTHLSCGNYAVVEDCVNASFAVVLSFRGLECIPSNVQKLIGDHFEQHIFVTHVYQVRSLCPGIINPMMVLRQNTVLNASTIRENQIRLQFSGSDWKTQDFLVNGIRAITVEEDIDFNRRITMWTWRAEVSCRGGKVVLVHTQVPAGAQTSNQNSFREGFEAIRQCLNQGDGPLLL
jgi:hypothetical protein